MPKKAKTMLCTVIALGLLLRSSQAQAATYTGPGTYSLTLGKCQTYYIGISGGKGGNSGRSYSEDGEYRGRDEYDWWWVDEGYGSGTSYNAKYYKIVVGGSDVSATVGLGGNGWYGTDGCKDLYLEGTNSGGSGGSSPFGLSAGQDGGNSRRKGSKSKCGMTAGGGGGGGGASVIRFNNNTNQRLAVSGGSGGSAPDSMGYDTGNRYLRTYGGSGGAGASISNSSSISGISFTEISASEALANGVGINNSSQAVIVAIPLSGSIRRTAVTQTSLTLSWSFSGANFDRYELYEGSSLIYEGTSTSFTHQNLTPGTYYTHKVRARVKETGGWTDYKSITSRTIPPTPPAPTATITPLSWSNTAGRGTVVLNWPAQTGATGYKVWVFDGNTYRLFDVGNVTTWDSSTARIYPSESQLDSYGDNTQSDDIFHHNQGGFDLRDNPNKLYKKTGGASCDHWTNYNFRISAYNEAGESPASDSINPTLPNRTDDTAPHVTKILLNEGNSKAGSTQIKVAVTAEDPPIANYTPQTDDDFSGLASIQVSNDNFATFTTFPWPTPGEQAGNHEVEWTIPPGEGAKNVYVRVTDRAGNISLPQAANIFLKDDNASPTVTLTINGGAEYTTNPTLDLVINAYDDMTPIDQLKMRHSFDGLTWTAWEPFAFTKKVTLKDTESGIKRVFVQVKDEAGNVATAGGQIKLMTEEEILQDKLGQRAEKDTEPPVIEVFSLVGGASVTTDSRPRVELGAYDNITEFENLRVQFRLADTNWTSPMPPSNVMTPNLTLSPVLNTLYIRVIDESGNKTEKHVRFFKN